MIFFCTKYCGVCKFLSVSYLWKVQFASTEVVKLTRHTVQGGPEQIHSVTTPRTTLVGELRDEPEQSGHHGDHPFHGRQEHSKAVEEAVLDNPAKSVDPDEKTFTAVEEGRGPERCQNGGN